MRNARTSERLASRRVINTLAKEIISSLLRGEPNKRSDERFHYEKISGSDGSQSAARILLCGMFLLIYRKFFANSSPLFIAIIVRLTNLTEYNKKAEKK